MSKVKIATNSCVSPLTSDLKRLDFTLAATVPSVLPNIVLDHSILKKIFSEWHAVLQPMSSVVKMVRIYNRVKYITQVALSARVYNNPPYLLVCLASVNWKIAPARRRSR